MGRTGTIVFLSFAALALLYLLALAIYAAFRSMSFRSPSPASPVPVPPSAIPVAPVSPVSAMSPATEPASIKPREITENIRVGSGSLNPTVESGAVTAGFKTLIGARPYQEDSLHVGITRAGALMAVICDGMGGLAGGAEASAMAVRGLFEHAQEIAASDNIPELLRAAAIDADLDVADMRAGEGGSGTTAVAALCLGGAAYWLSVGDSRIYLMRSHVLHRITRDHNYELELKYAVEAGEITPEEAARAKRPDALISYLGMGGLSLADTGKIELEPGDVLLLCSDGLTKPLPDLEIAKILDGFEGSPAALADTLAVTAVARGGARQDNTTVIVIVNSQ